MFKKKTTSDILGSDMLEEEKPKKQKRIIKEKKIPKEKSAAISIKEKLGIDGRMEIKELIKNKLVLGIVCIIIAGSIAFVIMPLTQSILSRSVIAIKIKTDVREGEILTSDKLEITKIGGFNAPINIIENIEDAEGAFAKIDMLAGDVLTSGKISSDIISDFKYLADLPKEKMAISFNMGDVSSSLSGKIRSRDIVRFYISNDEKETFSPAELQYVEVLAVTNADFNDIDNNTTSDEDSAAKEIITVTVIATDAQAKLIAGYNSSDKIHLALVQRGDGELKETLLASQQKFLDEK